MVEVKVKVFNGQKLPTIIKKGDWIDLSINEDIHLEAPQAGILRKDRNDDGELVQHRDVILKVNYLPLGVAMKLPKGYEAHIVSRSSTPKKYGVMCANSIGIIDNSYSGDNDEWKYPAIAIRETDIKKGTRICQFRIQLSQKATMWQKIKWFFSSGVKLVKVYQLDSTDRSGLGSTSDSEFVNP
jgi:dUTP pyrophosphatase